MPTFVAHPANNACLHRVIILLLTIGVVTPMAIATQIPSKDDLGKPAPDWLRQSETYLMGCNPANWSLLAQSKVKFITHCPVSRDYFARCHALEIHCLPYVTFYHGDVAEVDPNMINSKPAAEWLEVDDTGNYRRSAFWECEDNKNKYVLCPDVAAGRAALVAWVRRIMELGGDGVFLDVVRAREKCYGPKFGKHKHIYDDPDHAFAMLLKEVRETIKGINPDGALVINSGTPMDIPREYWKYVDADMLESYICTWVSKDRTADWKTFWHAQSAKLRPLLDAGKQIQALSYLGYTPYGVKEDAFFCYATARLAGFVWCGEAAFARSEAASLYRLSLGRPLHDEVEEGNVYWRAYEAGLVAVNVDRNAAAPLSVKSPIPTTRFCDVFNEEADPNKRVIDVAQSHQLMIPPYSGRVFLYAPSTDNELVKPGSRLTIITKPPIGEVCVRVDGFDYWTHAGYWGTEYKRYANFGSFYITFDKPGKHVVELIDMVPKDMKTSKSYNSAERMGEAMDPSDPTTPSQGRKFHFRGWTGCVTSSESRIEVDVEGNATLTANFEDQK